jgi:polar amino acid transport system substrate-binding protein
MRLLSEGPELFAELDRLFTRPSFKTLLAVIGILLLCRSAQADDRLSVTLTADEYPPLMGENLPEGGRLTRIVREAFKAGGVDVKILFLTNNRAIAGMMKDVYDGGYGWAHSKERDSKLLFSHTVIHTVRMVFFQRAGTTYHWDTLSDLRSYRIGATLGNYYSDDFMALETAPGSLVEFAGSDLANMKKLLYGRIDLFPMDEEVGRFLIQRELPAEAQARLTYQKQLISHIPMYVVMRRNLPNARELLDRFDRGYKQLAESGELARLVQEEEEAARKSDANQSP